jgi:hypothetical protein
MLYILPIDSYTIKFHDNNGHGQVYGIDLEARADLLGRIWISDTYLERNVLNSMPFSEIAFWDGDEYVTYATAQEFIEGFNSITILKDAIKTKDNLEFILTLDGDYITTKI